MKKISYAVLSIAFASTITMCTTKSPKGVDRANLNDSVAPQEDFYEYACGGWMKANPLKPEFSRFGTFDQLGENTRENHLLQVSTQKMQLQDQQHNKLETSTLWEWIVFVSTNKEQPLL